MTRKRKQPKNRKFWDFKLSASDEKVGELYLLGEISDTTWWGDETTPKNFLEELEELGDITKLEVHINSKGGDVFAAHTIGNLIRRHSAESIAYIDGVAASAATIIADCCDRTVMYTNTMMMVHHPLYGIMGYFNAKDFREMADDLDKIAESIIAVYAEKTGLDREDIIELMDEELWLTAEEALDWGFADEIENTKQVAASLYNNVLAIGGMKFDISQFKNFPKKQIPKRRKPKNIIKNKKDGEKKLEIKNIEELKNAYPDFVKEIEDNARNEGAEKERKRIKGIEDIAHNVAPDLLNKAKFEEPMNAEKLAFEAMKMDKNKGEEYMDKTIKDNKDSGADDVKASAADNDDKPKTIQDKAKNIVASFDAKRRGVKIDG